MESGQCLVDGLFVSFVSATSMSWLAGLDLDLAWTWSSLWCITVWWRGLLRQVSFPCLVTLIYWIPHLCLVTSDLSGYTLSSLIYVCLMAVWELRSGWRSLPRPQKLKPGLHACFNWFPRFHYGLIFLEETISMPVIFGPFIDLHYWRFYCKIVELGSQSALGLGESKWASLMVLTSD